MAQTTLDLVDYSERAIAVFGDTKNFKNDLIKIGGKFNPSLKRTDDSRAPGYIFSKTKRTVVENLLRDISTGTVKATPVEEGKRNYSNSNSATPIDAVDRKTFMALVSRVERLEQELRLMRGVKETPKKETPAKSEVVFDGDDDDDDDDDEPESSTPKPRLLSKKK